MVERGAQRPKPRAFWGPLAAILALGLVIRVLWLHELVQLPWFVLPETDADLYDRAARRIASGDTLLAGFTMRMSPGYFWFLGSVYRVLGAGPWPIHIAQLALGLCVPLLLWGAARHLVGPKWALLAAAAAASYGPFVFFESLLLPESLAVLLASVLAWACMHALSKQTVAYASWAGVGVALGALVLVRPNALLLALPIALAAALAGQPLPRRTRAVRTSLVLITMLAVISPLTARNLAATGEPVLLTAHGGLNLWIGNGPDATGLFRVPKEVPGADAPGSQFQAFHAAAEHAEGRSLDARAADSYWTRRTLMYLGAKPATALALFARKTHLFWNAYEPSLVYDYGFARTRSRVLGAPLLQWGAVAPFALAGLVVLLLERKASAARLTLAGLLAASMLSVIAVFVSDRYRLPSVPFGLLAATVLAKQAAHLLRARAWRPLAGQGALLAVGVALAWPVSAKTRFEREHYRLAMLHLELDDRPSAERELRAGLGLAPTHLPSLRSLASLLENDGRSAEARTLWQQALRAAEASQRVGDAEEARLHLARLTQ